MFLAAPILHLPPPPNTTSNSRILIVADLVCSLFPSRHDLRGPVPHRGRLRGLCQRRGVGLVQPVRPRPGQRAHAPGWCAGGVHVLHHVGADALLGQHAWCRRADAVPRHLLPCVRQCREVVHCGKQRYCVMDEVTRGHEWRVSCTPA